MAIKGQQMKVQMPDHLYAALWQEAKDTGVTMADLVRIAVKARYPGVNWDDDETEEVLAKKEMTN